MHDGNSYEPIDTSHTFYNTESFLENDSPEAILAEEARRERLIQEEEKDRALLPKGLRIILDEIGEAQSTLAELYDQLDVTQEEGEDDEEVEESEDTIRVTKEIEDQMEKVEELEEKKGVFLDTNPDAREPYEIFLKKWNDRTALVDLPASLNVVEKDGETVYGDPRIGNEN